MVICLFLFKQCAEELVKREGPPHLKMGCALSVNRLMSTSPAMNKGGIVLHLLTPTTFMCPARVKSLAVGKRNDFLQSIWQEKGKGGERKGGKGTTKPSRFHPNIYILACNFSQDDRIPWGWQGPPSGGHLVQSLCPEQGVL